MSEPCSLRIYLSKHVCTPFTQATPYRQLPDCATTICFCIFKHTKMARVLSYYCHINTYSDSLDLRRFFFKYMREDRGYQIIPSSFEIDLIDLIIHGSFETQVFARRRDSQEHCKEAYQQGSKAERARPVGAKITVNGTPCSADGNRDAEKVVYRPRCERVSCAQGHKTVRMT
jgi:hypothetical protein